MNYNEALNFISESHKFGMRLGLDNMKRLLELLGNPQEKLNIIHVAGTNGKGSTCSFISTILVECGYKVGLYTSPYLETFTERIRINNENIPEEKVANIISLIKEKIDIMIKEGYEYPTEFEIVTAMAFYYYFIENTDYVVLEVGLGGRYDATNVIDKSLVSVITSISLDHTGILGDTLEKIAYEKAGIIKENGTVFVYNQTDIVKNVIKEVCNKKNAKYIEVDFDDVIIKKSDINYQSFDYKKYKDIKINLIGEHQIKNSILALNVVEFILDNVNLDIIKKGIEKTKWAGRIEKLSKSPLFIIDGAHNEDGAKSLQKVLDKNLKDKNMTLIIGMLEDKDIDTVLEILIPYFNKVITTTPNNTRAISCDKLKDRVYKYNKNVTSMQQIEKAVEYVLENSKKDDVIICAGSLYMIGEVRKEVLKECR